MRIDLKVKHQRILGVQQIPRLVIEKTTGFVYLNLEFDDEWDNCNIIVLLTNDRQTGKPVQYTWTGELIEVAPELLVTGTLRVSCVGYGTDDQGETVLRLTTKRMSDGVRIHRAGDQEGVEPGTTVPGLWEQALAIMGPLHTLETQTKGNMVEAINEIYGMGIVSMEQTVFSEEDAGINEFTFTQADGTKTVLQMRNGSKGTPGRGVVGITCNPDGTWDVRYSDITHETLDNEAYLELLRALQTAKEEAVAATSAANAAAADASTAAGDAGSATFLANLSATIASDAAQSASKAEEELRRAAANGEFDGDPGIYYGTTEPTGPSHPIWINPYGEAEEPESGGGGISFEVDDSLYLLDGILGVNPNRVVLTRDLESAVDDALAQAKASGEFDGEDGYTPVKGKDYFDGKSLTFEDLTDEQKAELKGETGSNGIHVGSEPPEDEDIEVWVDTSEEVETADTQQLICSIKDGSIRVIDSGLSYSRGVLEVRKIGCMLWIIDTGVYNFTDSFAAKSSRAVFEFDLPKALSDKIHNTNGAYGTTGTISYFPALAYENTTYSTFNCQSYLKRSKIGTDYDTYQLVYTGISSCSGGGLCGFHSKMPVILV